MLSPLASLSASSNLAEVAGRLGISQNEISRRSGLAYQTVNDAWHGKPCTLGTWVRIAKAIQAPLGAIAPVAAAELDGLIIR
jgi:lambda repressor-like predicted transcriptional regulator